MEIQVMPYDLPDAALLKQEGEAVMVWQPDENVLVLGQSNHPEISLNQEAVLRDRVRVVKRSSGGETVILSPETLVISAIFQTETFGNPSFYFKKMNGKIMAALEQLGIRGLEQKGISDISVQNRKILGSSIYRHRSALMYHAVLNINESPATMERYLAHPSKEPDYRAGRSHKDFVTSLRELGCTADPEEIKSTLIRELSQKD